MKSLFNILKNKPLPATRYGAASGLKYIPIEWLENGNLKIMIEGGEDYRERSLENFMHTYLTKPR